MYSGKRRDLVIPTLVCNCSHVKDPSFVLAKFPSQKLRNVRPRKPVHLELPHKNRVQMPLVKITDELVKSLPRFGKNHKPQ